MGQGAGRIDPYVRAATGNVETFTLAVARAVRQVAPALVSQTAAIRDYLADYYNVAL